MVISLMVSFTISCWNYVCCTQCMSANITLPPHEYFLSSQYRHVDMVITNAILQKGTRGSFWQWDNSDYDLTVTRLQMPNTVGGYGTTPNTIEQTSAKVAMASRFLGLVGSLSPDEQNRWLPNQVVHDPDTWTTLIFSNSKENMRSS